MRVGLMELHGPAYQSALALVDLSRFKAVEGGKTTMFVRLEPFGEDLKLVDVQSHRAI